MVRFCKNNDAQSYLQRFWFNSTKVNLVCLSWFIWKYILFYRQKNWRREWKSNLLNLQSKSMATRMSIPRSSKLVLLKFNRHMNCFRILLKFRFWLSSSEVEPGILHFFFLSPTLLRRSWHMTLSTFKAYSVNFICTYFICNKLPSYAKAVLHSCKVLNHSCTPND